MGSLHMEFVSLETDDCLSFYPTFLESNRRLGELGLDFNGHIIY